MPVELDRANRRAYARQQRPTPEVRLVRIRTRAGSVARAGVVGGNGQVGHRSRSVKT